MRSTAWREWQSSHLGSQIVDKPQASQHGRQNPKTPAPHRLSEPAHPATLGPVLRVDTVCHGRISLLHRLSEPCRPE
jgi:hypothetical protein